MGPLAQSVECFEHEVFPAQKSFHGVFQWDKILSFILEAC